MLAAGAYWDLMPLAGCRMHASMSRINAVLNVSLLLHMQAWLDPVHLPSAEQLKCKASGKPLDFLLQVQAHSHALAIRRVQQSEPAAAPLCVLVQEIIEATSRYSVQVYATPSAFDQDPAAFHRTTFLFISPQVGD